MRHAQESYRQDFVACLRKTRGFKFDQIAFLDVRDPAHNAEKISANVAETYNILYMEPGIALIRHDDLIASISLARVGRVPTSAKAVERNKNAMPADNATK